MGNLCVLGLGNVGGLEIVSIDVDLKLLVGGFFVFVVF